LLCCFFFNCGPCDTFCYLGQTKNADDDNNDDDGDDDVTAAAAASIADG